MGEVKERNHGKNPSSAICAANTDISVMYGRKGLENNSYCCFLFLSSHSSLLMIERDQRVIAEK